jgi:hypothetical protein
VKLLSAVAERVKFGGLTNTLGSHLQAAASRLRSQKAEAQGGSVISSAIATSTSTNTCARQPGS